MTAVDPVTAWVMATIHCLHQFDNLLANEWRERVHLALLREVTAGLSESARFANLYRTWESQRPYVRGQDAGPDEPYPAYRRAKFDQFLAGVLRDLPENVRRTWEAKVRAAEADDLPAYQRQMSILAYLEPGQFFAEGISCGVFVGPLTNNEPSSRKPMRSIHTWRSPLGCCGSVWM